MDVNTFREIFVEQVLNAIVSDGYTYRSTKQMFVKTEKEHLFEIHVYMYKRNTFIEVETKSFYGNSIVDKELKELGIKDCRKLICGGNLNFICESYFNKVFPEKYSNLIYDFTDDVSSVITKWLEYYTSIIKPFFMDCTNPEILNQITNGKPDCIGFNICGEVKYLKSYFVGKRAGMKDEELMKLYDEYEEELKKFNPKYFSEFMKIKNRIKSNLLLTKD